MSAAEFRKQPVSPASDSEVVSSDGLEKPRPLSLLSSMMVGQTSPSLKRPAQFSGYTSGPSAPSTAPSTAFSSPRPQDEPVSILRRSSIGSDGEPFFLPLARVLPTSPAKSEPRKQARASALKFAVIHRPTEPERQPASTVPQPNDDDKDDELDQGTNTDEGYEEDSEDGFSSDDEPTFMVQAHKMALARARKAQLAAARPTSASPPPRSGHPPPRRGRGHVRVDPAVATGDSERRCSRHYSPPPDNRPRSAPPGPRDGRAGSPLPERMDIDDEDEDEEENTEENTAIVDTDDDDDNAMSVSPNGPTPASGPSPFPPASSIGTGMRNMLRRASEHLPSFRRPSFTAPIPEDSAVVLDDDNGSDNSLVLLSRARSLGSRTKPVASTLSSPPQDTCMPSRPIACPTGPR